MSILKIYNKMYPTSFFFFTSKKIYNMSLRNDQSVFKRSCISISNVLSVSTYNNLTTKRIVKKFFWKNRCHFFPKKSFVYQFSIPTYLTESSLVDFRRSVFLKFLFEKVSGRFKNDYIHETEHSWLVNVNKAVPILAVYCV